MLQGVVAPSIICANYLNLGRDLEIISSTKLCSYLHVDVMDGSFVEQITIGSSFLEWCKKGAPSLLMDVHLMVEEPEKHIETFIKAGGDILTYHIEATDKHSYICEMIRNNGKKCGIAIKPSTSFDDVKSIIQKNIAYIDNILVCTVEPGYYGQSFLHNMLEKISTVRKFLDDNQYRHITLEVDGGINTETVSHCKESGANVFVVGNALFYNKHFSLPRAIESFAKLV